MDVDTVKKEYMYGTTCHRHMEVVQVFHDRFILFKHRGHYGYYDSWTTKSIRCQSYYALVDCEASEDVSRFSCSYYGVEVWRHDGRWSKKAERKMSCVIQKKTEV